MKKVLSAIIAILCVISIFAFVPAKSDAATAMTEASFQKSLEKFKKTVYDEGATYKNNSKLYGGAQCFGYANQLAKYIYGSYPTGSMSGVGVSNGWQVSYGAKAVDSLHVGDIVRFLYHSIFITDIYNGYVFFTDANSDGANTVSWEGCMEVSYLKDLVSEKLSSGVCSADGIWHTGWVAHYKNWKKMPRSIVNFDANCGANATMLYGEIGPRSVEEGASFVLLQYFSYYDYIFTGCTVRRDSDNKWYVSGKGWLTQEEIDANGYSKKIYKPGSKVTVDSSWKQGMTGSSTTFTLFSQWGRNKGLTGDANGDGTVDITDAMLIFYNVAKKENVFLYRRSLCDINLDLEIDISDAMKVFYYVAKKSPSLD